MRAIRLDEFGPPSVLKIGAADKPTVGQGQVLIDVAASSVNRPDVVQRQGNYPPPPGESEIPGLEVAGTIAEVAPGVGWQVGARVMALVGGGGYAEYAVAHAAHLIAIPDGLSFEEAACIPEAYITAYQNLFLNARLEDGQSVLAHGGGGGVNTAAIQICKAIAPSSLVIVTASTGKLDRVRAIGADAVIDYTREDFADRVKEMTDGRGVDVILDHIGASYFQKNLAALAVGGRLAIIATLGGREASLNLARLMVKRQSIIGSVLRPRDVEDKAAIIAAFERDVMPHVASGKIKPLIDRVLTLEEAAQAHEIMESSGHFGKIVLRVSH